MTIVPIADQLNNMLSDMANSNEERGEIYLRYVNLYRDEYEDSEFHFERIYKQWQRKHPRQS